MRYYVVYHVNLDQFGMEYAVQAIKVSENLVQTEENARAPKTGFHGAVSLNLPRFLCAIIN